VENATYFSTEDVFWVLDFVLEVLKEGEGLEDDALLALLVVTTFWDM